MAILNANTLESQINFPKDGIITQKYIAGIPGGRALKTAGYPLSVIFAGTPVIKETATGDYKPFPLVQKTETVENVTTPVVDEDGNPVYVLGTLPEGHTYAGILYKSIKTKNPAAAIMTEGQVNIAALYYSLDSILSAFKAACPLIEFISDEEAK